MFAVGHSNHPLEVFLALLARHRIDAVADVRSVPRSRFAPRFDHAPLAAALREARIAYVPLVRELGLRADDPACYEDGRLRYDRVAATGRFRRGIDRIAAGAVSRRIALMCAEKEPLDCHRTLLVARALDERRDAVAHIHADGALEPHACAMERLVAKFRLEPGGDLFHPPRSQDEPVADAVAHQSRAVAFAGGPAVPERPRP